VNAVTWVLLVFSVLGALDRILGNRFGLGKEFERGFELFGSMSLSMIGMLVMAPAIGVWLTPVFEGFYHLFGIDPSALPAMLLANDMGGATLSEAICKDEGVGAFNAYVISSMMGCVISFTIPFAAGVVKKEQHKSLFFGFLCGIVTIPVGCLVAGLICGLTVLQVLVDLLPMLILALLVGVGLVLIPAVCVKVLQVFGGMMKILITVGLLLGIIAFLTGKVIVPEFDTLESGAMVCVNACVTLSGAFPLMYLVSKLLRRPFTFLGSKLGINTTAAVCLLPTLVSSTPIWDLMKDMDDRGVVLNAAFAVSASFVFGAHLAFTMAFDPSYVLPMIVGKMISGISALVLALVLYRKKEA